MGGRDFNSYMMDEDKYLLPPYLYISKIPGKNVRVALIRAFNSWLNIPTDKLELVQNVINMLHTGSLLIDDIEDNSELRRGVPVAHKVYGVPMTINCANAVYFKALEKIVATNDLSAIKVFTEEMVELHQGQGMDIYFRDNYICPTEQEYKIMVCKKTGGLFRMAIRLMQVYSNGCGCELMTLVDDIGYYFQILDDYLNLRSSNYHDNKTFCEDITEGKFSFPMIHSIRSNNQDSRLFDIIKTRPTDIATKQQALKVMESTGSFKYTIMTLDKLYTSINTQIVNLGGNKLLTEILRGLNTMINPSKL